MNYRRIYADGYSYYLTFVTHGRKAILIENIDLLRSAFKLSKNKYSYKIDAIVGKAELSSKKYHRGHAGIWQERFYEHTIRDEKDWLEKMEYIKNNPIKHNYVANLADWKYSSFYNHP